MKPEMKKNADSLLRRKAEDLLKAKKSNSTSGPRDIETLKLIHELEVHQIELELQNDELLAAKEIAEKAALKYTELYEYAPTGYFTISQDGNIIDLNNYGAQMLSGDSSYLLNKRFGFFISHESLEPFNSFIDKVFKSGVLETCDISIEKKSLPAAYLRLSGITTGGGRQCLVTAVDWTGRKEAEDKVAALLAEKELLLQEVHHRVKNNMNTIRWLLFMHSESAEDPSVAVSINEAENCIISMMTLYDKLYCSDGFGSLSVHEYFYSLVDEIILNFPNRSIVKIVKNIEDFIMDVKILAPLGIIVNELLTNMMKYAFKGRESGVITFSASEKDGLATVSIGDNGIGIPESVNFENSTGFGIRLVSMLADQISGKIRIERAGGTKFIIEFPLQ